VADAGYKLISHFMTTYKYEFQMPKHESNFNYQHSRTRIVVECAFGLLISRFSIYRVPLNLNSLESNINLIVAILHNMLIDFGEHEDNIFIENWMHIGSDSSAETDEYQVAGLIAKQRRDAIANYILNLI
jgi:hypothetical protein